MKPWKLVTGILSIIGALTVLLSSCGACMNSGVHSMGDDYNGAVDIAYILYRLLGISLILLIAGITSVVTSKGKSLSNLILLILYGLGAVVSLQFEALKQDDPALDKAGWEMWCMVWGIWCIICALGALIGVFVTRSKKQKAVEQTQQDPE